METGATKRLLLLMLQTVLVSFAAKSATESRARLRHRGVDLQHVVVDGLSTLFVPSSTIEDTYSLLESAATMSVPEVEQKVLLAMQQTSSQAASLDDAPGTVDMDLLGVTAALMGLASRSATDSSPSNETRKKFVDNMDDLVDQLRGHIHSANKPSQDRLDTLIQAFDTCNSTLTASLSAAESLDGAVASRRDSHRRCREDEDLAWQAWVACNNQSLAAASPAQEPSEPVPDECYKWPALKATSPGEAGRSCMEVQLEETYEDYLRRMKSHWEEQLFEYERLKALCDNRTTTTTPEPSSDCSELKARWEQKKLECNEEQGRFERTYCDQARHVNDAWDTYFCCYDSANKTYWQAVSTEQKNVQARKSELRATKRIDCLLKVFSDHEDPAAAIEECREKTHSAHGINVTVHEEPPRLEAPEPQSVPGMDSFHEEEYASLPEHAPAGSMLMCALKNLTNA